MPSWQSARPDREHVKFGICWCGYVNGRFPADGNTTAGLYGRTVVPSSNRGTLPGLGEDGR